MYRLFTIIIMALYSGVARAGLLDIYRLEDGHTNWQYVANTTGAVLILAMSYTLFRLYKSHRAEQRHNRELEVIRAKLEERVRERTATLAESQAYLDNILRSMPLMLVGLDAEGRITQWNPAAEAMTSLKAKEVLGQDLWRAYPLITVTRDQFEEAIHSRKQQTIRQSQRGHFHFDVTLYPLQQQSEPGLVILVDDVTERVAAENSLIERDKMSSMGELAGYLAYDISSPLQIIQQDIRQARDALASGEESPDHALIDAVERTEQVSALVANLLQFSRARAEQMKPADITEIIEHSLALAEAVLMVPSGLRFKDIEIVRKYEPDLPPVPCHATELQQMFLSLLRHCTQALGEVERADHRPQITLEAKDLYGALWLKVQHNGRGLSLAEQQVLFEPYFAQGGAVAADDYDAGRRLSYAHFIVSEQHRGQIAVTSDPEIGTTFHLQLLLN